MSAWGDFLSQYHWQYYLTLTFADPKTLAEVKWASTNGASHLDQTPMHMSPTSEERREGAHTATHSWEDSSREGNKWSGPNKEEITLRLRAR